MTLLLSLTLIAHVLLGIIGVGASYAYFVRLYKKTLPTASLRRWSLAAFMSYFLSWITAGYYYVVYYGSSVKPLVQKSLPWAHTVFMETKEHLFLFLPFLALVLFVATFVENNNEAKPSALSSLRLLAGTILVIGIFVTLAGVVISSAAH